MGQDFWKFSLGVCLWLCLRLCLYLCLWPDACGGRIGQINHDFLQQFGKLDLSELPGTLEWIQSLQSIFDKFDIFSFYHVKSFIYFFILPFQKFDIFWFHHFKSLIYFDYTISKVCHIFMLPFQKFVIFSFYYFKIQHVKTYLLALMLLFCLNQNRCIWENHFKAI